ncbi:MAG TPA: DUF4157 domain-containing protein [Chitinophagaceae bacterium]|nr:DUF4157 domain-containing protein [Chitinophagaceae bacterium]
MDYRIKERSWIARIAAWKLSYKRLAIVMGSTIHLHNATKDEFLANTRWVKHELCHVRQFRRYGFIRFLVLYLWESMRKGYYMNKYEVEARRAESQ